MTAMDLRIFLTISWIMISEVDCQNPIANHLATVQPPECAAPNCDCCYPRDCNTCNGTCRAGTFGGKCRSQCPEQCVSCYDYGATNPNYRGYGYCTECKPGYYSVPPDFFQCNYNCPAGCVSCQSANQCRSCDKGYYLVSTSHGYVVCMPCLSSCKACTSSTSCSECKAGFEGNACENCKAGFYGVNCNLHCSRSCRDTICLRSSGDCVNCYKGFTGKRCNGCEVGLYGTACDQKCPENCKDAVCHKYYRRCYNCVDNFVGNECDKCMAGKHGANCTEDCPRNCYEDTCNRDTGFCNNCSPNFQGDMCEECKDGRYGTDCSLPCPINCKDKACKRESGTCSKCNESLYGPYCNKPCSSNCIVQTCNQDGVCHLGCKIGYSGDMCCIQGDNCVKCSSNEKCSTCVVGKYGETCERDCPASCGEGTCNKADGSCPKTSDQGSDPVPAGAIAGGVVGVAVVIGATVVLVVYLRKKRQDQRKPKSSETHMYDSVSDTSNQANRGAVTTHDVDVQIIELQRENQRLIEENERLLSDRNVSSDGYLVPHQSHYTSLDKGRMEENGYEGLRH